MKVALFLFFLENLVLYFFRPWGQEKTGWTIMVGIGMWLALVIFIYIGWREEKRKDEEEKKKIGSRYRAGL